VLLDLSARVSGPGKAPKRSVKDCETVDSGVVDMEFMFDHLRLWGGLARIPVVVSDDNIDGRDQTLPLSVRWLATLR